MTCNDELETTVLTTEEEGMNALVMNWFDNPDLLRWDGTYTESDIDDLRKKFEGYHGVKFEGDAIKGFAAIIIEQYGIYAEAWQEEIEDLCEEKIEALIEEKERDYHRAWYGS